MNIITIFNFNLSVFAMAGLSLGVCCLFLAILVFMFAKQTLHRIWALFNFAVFVWAFGTFLAGISDSFKSAEFAWRFTYGFGAFVPCVFYHFIWAFCELEDKKFLILVYSSAIFFALLNFFSENFIITIDYLFNSIFYNQATILYSIFIFYLFAVVAFAFKELIITWQNSKGNKRIQSLYLLVGLAIGWVAGFTTFLPSFGVPLYPRWHFAVCIYTALSTYAIFKHNLMDIEIVVKRSIVYSLLILIISFIDLILILSFEHFLQGAFGYKSFLISLMTAFLLSLTFFPLRSRIQRFVDRLFIKGSPLEIAEQNEFLRREVGEKEKFRAIATLISGIAHEIKNPMTSLKTFHDFLPQKHNDPEFMKKFEDITGRELSRIDRLTRQLLEFAKPSAPDLKPTEIESLIENTLALIRPEAVNKKVTIVTDFKTNNTMLNVDGQQIQQAVLNLCLNAIDAMAGGGTLTIKTTLLSRANGAISTENPRILSSSHGLSGDLNKINSDLDSRFRGNDKIVGSLLISFTDTGTGIPPDKIKNLFNPFYTTKENGTGLGLMITKEIVEKHKGKIDVKSEVGKGTEFVITLPVEKI